MNLSHGLGTGDRDKGQGEISDGDKLNIAPGDNAARSWDLGGFSEDLM